MQTRRLGPFMVSAVGLGAMPLSMGDRVSPDRDQAIATVYAALDAGVTFIDTADIYAPSWDTIGHNERVVSQALAARGDTNEVIVGTKGGITRGQGESWGRDGSPAYLRRAVEASLRALRREVIDLYQWHRPDRSRVYGEVIETFKALQDEGKIRAVGISNANIE
ncbi:MAG: aldo/keto reductase, partial [Terracoccus sp.]